MEFVILMLNMNATKRRKLENAGWRVGNAKDFLKLTSGEQKEIQLHDRVNRSRKR